MTWEQQQEAIDVAMAGYAMANHGRKTAGHLFDAPVQDLLDFLSERPDSVHILRAVDGVVHEGFFDPERASILEVAAWSLGRVHAKARGEAAEQPAERAKGALGGPARGDS
jgi:hypothetical protein